MKIISVVGRKNTGKTSLTVKIIEELTKRGWNVSSIKHSHHTMEMDKKNTDTWKHSQAGSEIVVGVGSTTFFNIKKDMSLNRILFLLKHITNIDYVVIEGFKSYNYPKIATSSDVVDEYTIKEVDSFKITDDELKDLVDLIESRTHDITDTLFANNCGYNNSKNISHDIRNGTLKTSNLDKTHSFLSIDGKVVGLNRFVSEYLKQSVLGSINALNLKDYGVGDIKNIELIIPESEGKKQDLLAEVIINDKTLPTNKFTNNIVANSIMGMIKSLKTPKINTIDIEIKDIEDDIINSKITLKINGDDIKINKFTQSILKETIYAVINTLKSDEIKNLKIKVVKQWQVMLKTNSKDQ